MASFTYKTLSLSKVAVIGAGQIGPDICLHFSKVFWNSGVQLVLIDISEEALARAQTRMEQKIDKGLETGAFSPDMARQMKSAITYTSDYEKARNADLVVEAATEDGRIKDLIFRRLEQLTAEACIFLSNSSHMQPEVIFENVQHKKRCLVAHYFFPAERNPVIEIVPGAQTAPEMTELLLGFYEWVGKIPIEVKSSYGYAIDPIFEGLCQLSIHCLEKGYGTVKQIDKVAQKTLKQGVGSFTALNLTGGNPITNHGLEEMRKTHVSWFLSPPTLQAMTQSGGKWDTAKRGEEVEISPETAELLRKQLLGGYFALAAYIIDRGITNVDDLNMATEIALVIAPPFTLMNKTGIEESCKLVEAFCVENPGFPFPQSLKKAREAGGWAISRIKRSTKDQVAVLTIRRPQALNALNLEVLDELKAELEKAEADAAVKGVVITGFGVKAFVSGADIQMLAALKSPEEGIQNSQDFQATINCVERMKKPVVCALNGFAFGGGNELAMACTARIAKAGLKVMACQPEVNLGFIPGAGGTQRLPRLVGVEKAAEILRTGRAVSSKEALEIGLIHKEAKGDLIEEAVALVRRIADGNIPYTPLSTAPLAEIGQPKDLNIGHLSKRIDAILVDAIYQGARMPLTEGLAYESKMFGECMKTEDMKIGLENFKTNGPKAKAEFVHR